VFFSRQDDRPGASNGQRAIAAEKGKTAWQATTRHLAVQSTARPCPARDGSLSALKAEKDKSTLVL
jgi:hypothetical protein